MRALRRLIFRHAATIHRIGLRLGVRITPDHYYAPVANLAQLERERSHWARRSDMAGINVDLDAQADSMTSMCAPYQQEYVGNAVYKAAVRDRFGPGYGPIEAQALHAVIRHLKPRRIIEIGGGVSTACMLAALGVNHEDTGQAAHLTCIEPFPSDPLLHQHDIQLIRQPVQRVSPRQFDQLGCNDLLFVDSSHAIRPDGDANHIILEILPRLRPGVIVHFHDIFFPYDHQPDALRTVFHWMETALLRAYLAENERMSILFCMSQLHHDRPQVLHDCFPDYDPLPLPDGLLPDDAPDLGQTRQHFPASIYLRKC